MTACECDEPTLLLPKIPAGLDALPRQLRSFPEVREALLRGIPSKPKLRGWNARGERDLGLMWLEMWAYVSDVLAFYDERIANESYLRTAQRRPSLRRLIELLGYIQNPGIAGGVTLALLADGRQSVSLPAGTAFRSDAFEGEPPQVFELDQAAVIHPFQNSWEVGSIRQDVVGLRPTPRQEENPALISSTGTRFLIFQPSDFALAKDQLVVLQASSEDQNPQSRVSRVKNFSSFTGPDGNNYLEVELEHEVSFPSGTLAPNVKVLSPTLSARPTRNTIVEPGIVDPFSPRGTDAIYNDTTSSTVLVLDAVYPQLRNGDFVVLSVPGTSRPEIARILDLREVRVALPPPPATIPAEPAVTASVVSSDAPDTTTTVEVAMTAEPPPVTVTATLVRLNKLLASTPSRVGQVTVHFNLAHAGALTTVPLVEITEADMSGSNRLAIAGPVERPPAASQGELTQPFLLRDVDGLGAAVRGSVRFFRRGNAQFVRHAAQEGEEQILPSVLKAPLTIYGNLVTATRGQSVFNEVLGSGDPRVANQQFLLRKKPLTYLDAPSDPRGFKSTLRIHVSGVEWREVKSFFGHGPEDQVFVVRHDDDQDTIITFGDGARGARLPAGVENVVANYRFGAGRKAPPAGAIQQIARPVPGLSDVISPIAAKNGRDPDDADALRGSAPRSLLTLGRAVSVPDFEALAQQMTGMVKAVAEFAWLAAEQRAGVKVLFIGSPTQQKVEERLRGHSDPNLPLRVEPARSLSSSLFITIGVDPRFEADAVSKALEDLLIDENDGLLSLRKAEIGGQFWSSRLYAAALSVPGVVEVRSALLTEPTLGQHFLNGEDVVCVPPSSYFDFGAGSRVFVTAMEPIGTLTGARRGTGGQ